MYNIIYNSILYLQANKDGQTCYRHIETIGRTDTTLLLETTSLCRSPPPHPTVQNTENSWPMQCDVMPQCHHSEDFPAHHSLLFGGGPGTDPQACHDMG